jgi:hypothetical protein
VQNNRNLTTKVALRVVARGTFFGESAFHTRSHLCKGSFFMRERMGAGRPPTVTSLEGEPLTREDLPEHADIRWVRRRKARVVAAVRGGILSLHEALERYSLSLEEFIEWEREVAGELAERRRTGRLRELTRVGRGKTGRRRRSN